MFRLDLGRAYGYCDGLDRRSFLQVGVSGLAALGLPHLAQAREAAGARRDTSVILIWLDGGPGHMDMYDMKPDAPAEYRGIWRPIRSRVPGFDVTELYPRQSRVTDKFSMIRSLHHNTGDHFAAGHRILTAKDMGVSGANTDGKFPSIGSIVSREVGPRRMGMPAYAAVPHAASIGLVPGYFGAHLLGPRFNPFPTGGDPNSPSFRVQNMNLAGGLSIAQLEDRRTLTRHFDETRRRLVPQAEALAMDRFAQEAFDFVTGPAAREAFEINREDPRLRDRYGRTNIGQSTLLARRLVEAGSTFVNVHSGGWDHHWDLQESYERLLPQVDAAVATLFEDLDDRGLLEKTLVILCGEFSRTPRMNDGSGRGMPGRDHWGDSMFCLIGGGGVQGGRVIGSTDALGQRPATRPLTPSNLHATIYHVLGIDPHLSLTDHTGRPITVLDDPAPIHELF
jgi:hypothetical protein